MQRETWDHVTFYDVADDVAVFRLRNKWQTKTL